MGFKSITPQAIGLAGSDGVNRLIAHHKLGTDYYQLVEILDTGEVAEPFKQLLDTTGDGTGTKEAAVDHSGAVEEYKLVPATGKALRVHFLDIIIEDNAVFPAGSYGAMAAAGVGLKITVENGTSTVSELIDGQAVKQNADWARAGGEVSFPGFASGNTVMRVRFDLEQIFGAPIRLNATDSEYLAVKLNDNFSTLVSHQFLASGHVE